jgi:hypothetical protein
MMRKPCMRYHIIDKDSYDEIAVSSQYHCASLDYRGRKMGVCHLRILRRGRFTVSSEEANQTQETNTRRDHCEMAATNIVCN